MKYAVLATVGLSHYVPSVHLPLVDSPPGCPAANAMSGS
jgi:hypothetical protein